MASRLPSWLSAAALLASLTVLSRLVGFSRDALIAFRFGASSLTDAYLIALLIPNFLTAVLSGALGALIVPRIAGELARGREREAWRLTLGAAIWALGLLFLFVLGIELLTVPVVTALAPGFTETERQTAASLSHILVWVVVFSTSGYLAGSILNAYHRFAFAAAAPMAMSGTAALALAVFPHPTIELLARALLVGAVLQFLITFAPLVSYLVRLRPMPLLKDKGLKTFARLSTPILLSSMVSQSNLAIDRIFGSTLVAGSIAALSFADRILQVPLGVFGAAISTSLFPRLARAHATHDREQFQDLLSSGLRLVLLITLPITALILALGPVIIALLFRHGAFSVQNAALTSSCLYAFALALIPYSLNIVITRAYYVIEETRFIGLSSLGVLVLNIVLDFWLARTLQAPGIALGTTIIEWAYIGLLAGHLQRGLGRFDARPALRLGTRLLIPAAAAAAAARLIAMHALGALAHTPFLSLLVTTLVAAAAALILYAALLWVLRVPEMRRILRRMETA